MIGATLQGEHGRLLFLGLNDEDVAVIKDRNEILISEDQLKDFGLEGLAITVFHRPTDQAIYDSINAAFPAMQGRQPKDAEVLEVKWGNGSSR